MSRLREEVRPPAPRSRDPMFLKFRLYGFLKNLRFFDPFLLLYFRESGLSFLSIGALYSVRAITVNVLEIPTGLIADTYGRRRSLIAAFACYLGSFALLFALRRFSAFALSMVLFGIGEAFRSGTHKALILEHLRQQGRQDEKVAYYGRTRAASQLGSAVSALIAAGLVFATGGYRVVFLASIAPYVLGLLLILTYPPRLDARDPSLTGGHTAAQRLKSSARIWLAMFRRMSLNLAMINSATFDALFGSVKDYLQPLLQSQAIALPFLLAFSETQRVALLIGVMYASLYGCTSLAASLAGTVEARSRSISSAANGTFAVGTLTLVAAGISAWLDWYALAAVAFVALYVIHNLRRPLMVGYLAGLIPHQAMASGLSAESQAKSLLVAAFAPLVGWLADHVGIGPAILAAGVTALVLLPFLRVGSHRPPKPVT